MNLIICKIWFYILSVIPAQAGIQCFNQYRGKIFFESYILFLLAGVIIFFGCSEKQPVSRNSEIKRIVSLSPSITKQIIDLEAESMLVGITSYCPKTSGAVIVGNLTNPVSETILNFKPDIVLSSDEDSAVQKLSALENSGIRIYKFKKNNSFEDIISNYMELGKLIGKEELSFKKSEQYIKKRNSIIKHSSNYKAAFFISHRPLIAASSKTYINGILNDSGLQNIYNGLNVSYPIISIETIVKNNPDFIFSMDSKPVDFFKRHLENFDISAVKNQKLFYIDPDHISSYTPQDYIDSIIGITALVKIRK
jgi:iron complex transport system substrate-binding protein